MLSITKESEVNSILQNIRALKDEVKQGVQFTELPQHKQYQISLLNISMEYLIKFKDQYYSYLNCHDCGGRWKVNPKLSAYDGEIVLECKCGAKYFNAQDHFIKNELEGLEKVDE